ncbi:MAG TPA: molybdenum cofactor biosynthesis protein MoeB [Cytophagales bacterium]|nr:molybdenum cofactor biosynthesis protein MoeB [Cytophagales bacterium]HAA23537.1 molybdenum cofactor biosynthesis protein MoeB [Cytophagales bacterium]HAP59349.1 molybdenum cofactor biosynthesis protein MoeB [Cytophagales bacterium]
MEFSKEELERYSRHLIIPEFNIDGQRKLKAAKVLVVGSGGLGSPLLLYLAAAGVGTIGIVDFDTVDKTNLQRQVLFTVDDEGKSKAQSAKARLEKLNPHIELVVHETQLTSANALEIIEQYDLVADGTDNFPTRYLVNDACVLLDKVNVYASIFRFEGQVSVFNYVSEDGTRGPNYRDIFPEPPPPGLVPSCAEGGVLGVLPGIVGSLQANEVIKVITGVGEPLAGRLFLFDAASFTTRTLKLRRDPNNPLNGEHPTQTALIDYEQFCGLKTPLPQEEILENITVQELADWQQSGESFTLIDVREPYEYEIAHLGGILTPQKSLTEHIEKIPREGKVVLHCRSGKRSGEVIRLLKKEHGYTNLINLEGGILAYAEEIDNSLAKY